MNKSELIMSLAEKLSVEKAVAEKMLNTLVDMIVEELKKGGEVTITGPSEKIQIHAVTVPKFKAGKTLKDALKA
jgi:DNA-binding protein HU-beta